MIMKDAGYLRKVKHGLNRVNVELKFGNVNRSDFNKSD